MNTCRNLGLALTFNYYELGLISFNVYEYFWEVNLLIQKYKTN